MSLIASLVLVLALGLVGFALSAANQQSAISALQARMESYAFLVLAAAELGENGQLQFEEDLGDPRLSQPGSGIYIHIHGQAGHWSSPSTLGLELPELNTMAPAEIAFSLPTDALNFYVYQYGVAWQLADETTLPFTVSVLVAPDEIGRQTSAFRLGLWRALGAAGVILLLAQLMVIYLGFRPLQRVAIDVASVESGLSPGLQGHYPSELEPLARNVNKLLATEKANQQRYRNALDSLAHSLKTPLAILRAGLESNSTTGQAAMRRATDEMHQLVATRLQRAALSARRTMARPISVRPEIERILASLEKVYSHKMISVEVTIPADLEFYGEQRDWLELMGNLLDNAFKYGKSRVRINGGRLDSPAASEIQRSGLWMQVEDDGPGIDPQEWPVLLRRGVRGDEREEGHGLGLAIVLELLTAYGGKIDINDSELGGTLIKVEIPAS
jgi:two-component system sensor histidine kinase PhoQ